MNLKPSAHDLAQRAEAITSCICMILGQKTDFPCSVPIDNLIKLLLHIFSVDGSTPVRIHLISIHLIHLNADRIPTLWF